MHRFMSDIYSRTTVDHFQKSDDKSPSSSHTSEAQVHGVNCYANGFSPLDCNAQSLSATGKNSLIWSSVVQLYIVAGRPHQLVLFCGPVLHKKVIVSSKLSIKTEIAGQISARGPAPSWSQAWSQGAFSNVAQTCVSTIKRERRLLNYISKAQAQFNIKSSDRFELQVLTRKARDRQTVTALKAGQWRTRAQSGYRNAVTGSYLRTCRSWTCYRPPVRSACWRSLTGRHRERCQCQTWRPGRCGTNRDFRTSWSWTTWFFRRDSRHAPSPRTTDTQTTCVSPNQVNRLKYAVVIVEAA